MTLEIGPGSISITDTDGHPVFSTSEKLFYARSADYVTGTVTLPVRDTGTTGTATYTLGTVDASAIFIRGAMQVSTYSSTGVQYDGIDTGIWVNVSGTFVMTYTGNVMRTLTIVNDAGTVNLIEDYGSLLQQNAFGQTYQIAGASIDFKLICGQFT